MTASPVFTYQSRRDAICEHIDLELFSWLTETLQSEPTGENAQDLLTGALAGCVRFLWAIKDDDATPEKLEGLFVQAARHFLAEAQRDGGVRQ